MLDCRGVTDEDRKIGSSRVSASERQKTIACAYVGIGSRETDTESKEMRGLGKDRGRQSVCTPSADGSIKAARMQQ